MKSKELQKVVLSKWYLNKNLSSFKWWDCCKNNQTVVSVWLYQIVKSTANIQKVKHRLRSKKRVSARKLSMNLLRFPREACSANNGKRLGRCPYKKGIEPLLKRSNGKTFANWLRTNFGKENTMTILFSDQTLMVSTNSENDRVCPEDRAHAEKKAAIKQRQKGMLWLSASSNGITFSMKDRLFISVIRWEWNFWWRVALSSGSTLASFNTTKWCR